MVNSLQKLPADDDALTELIFWELNARADADPYAWDGALAVQLSTLPPGLAAAAATHLLDKSLALDDIGWHFLNFGEAGLVQWTTQGLQEFGLGSVATMFDEAYQLVGPLLPTIRVPEGDYYGCINRAGCKARLAQLSNLAIEAIGEGGVYPHWVHYCRRSPDRVFGPGRFH